MVIIESSKRSIPACTGEPRIKDLSLIIFAVYPRVYGGTRDIRIRNVNVIGLSPRVRGNQCRHIRLKTPLWSIPACTGEPEPSSTSACVARVYPRVYGGTGRMQLYPLNPHGLSPRVRGNHRLGKKAIMDVGSIPACTGEPSCNASNNSNGTVYPRVYGGTIPDISRPAKERGLSPRVRGNRIVHSLHRHRVGSIPACTGEPHKMRPAATVTPVYPRVYGGTVAMIVPPSGETGLSPRVRGNPVPG